MIEYRSDILKLKEQLKREEEQNKFNYHKMEDIYKNQIRELKEEIKLIKLNSNDIIQENLMVIQNYPHLSVHLVTLLSFWININFSIENRN